MPKMAIPRVFITSPSRSVPLLPIENTYEGEVGYLATLAYRNRLGGIL